MRGFTRRHVVQIVCLCLALQYGAFAQDAPRFPSVAPDHAPPPDYTGMVFELSQDYPAEAPTFEKMPWDSISFSNRGIILTSDYDLANRRESP